MTEPEKTLLRSLIDATGLSRRKAFAAIREGRLTRDGRVVVDPSAPYTDGRLALDGRGLSIGAPPKVYLLMNKPAGLLSAVSDARGRTTVIDLVPERLRASGLHPVGRLDQDSTGLLLLTNDGDLTHRLTHPRNEVEKEYWLALAKPLSDAGLEALRGGVEIDGAVRAPVRVERLEDAAPYEISVVIREGRKRQVRRMVAAVGGRTQMLMRVREGELRLGRLVEGSVRELNPRELRLLGVRPS